MGVVDRNGYCDYGFCRSCQDCAEHIKDCLCYTNGAYDYLTSPDPVLGSCDDIEWVNDIAVVRGEKK
jgi:hypothetical protein